MKLRSDCVRMHDLLMEAHHTQRIERGNSSQNLFPRHLADLNKDGADDLVGFGAGGAYASLANGAGGFAASELIINAFGASQNAGGWTDDIRNPRFVVDLNGDGYADFAGIGNAGVSISYTLGFDL